MRILTKWQETLSSLSWVRFHVFSSLFFLQRSNNGSLRSEPLGSRLWTRLSLVGRSRSRWLSCVQFHTSVNLDSWCHVVRASLSVPSRLEVFKNRCLCLFSHQALLGSAVDVMLLMSVDSRKSVISDPSGNLRKFSEIWGGRDPSARKYSQICLECFHFLCESYVIFVKLGLQWFQL